MATTAKDYRGHQQVDDFSPRKSENLDEFPSDKPPHLDSTRTYQTEDMAHTEDKDSSESSGRAPRSFRQSASEAARKAISERMSNSVIGNALSMSEIPEFDIKEFVLGKRLGKGAFSDVDEIRAMVLFQTNTARKPRQPPRHSDSMAMNDKESRLFIAEHCTRASGDSRYALKLLKRDVRKDKERFMSGLCDLAMEVRFLSGLTHPNIIKLRAVSSASEYSSDYFLVLDRLYDTLAKRLLKWQSRKKDLKRFLGQLKDRKGVQLLDFYEDRIERAYDLSAALEYCHSKNIIHRDLVSTTSCTANTELARRCRIVRFPIRMLGMNVLTLSFGGRLFVLQKPDNIGFDCVSNGIDDGCIHKKETHSTSIHCM
jgi:serine/threonine protein kinase